MYKFDIEKGRRIIDSDIKNISEKFNVDEGEVRKVYMGILIKMETSSESLTNFIPNSALRLTRQHFRTDQNTSGNSGTLGSEAYKIGEQAQPRTIRRLSNSLLRLVSL